MPSFTSSSSTSDFVTAGTWSRGRDCEQVNPWGESSPDDHRSEGQGRPGTETNTPPAAERNLLTAQGRPGTETNTPPAAERNLLTAQGRPGTETNTPPAAERGI
ncbi:Poly [ADP-ribose] polymerase 1 [Dissostichus eleginoides]|uniref:Poly [ADP-ribose] polymerase 1 n=1 Tax=Dissostichus eleginoides TaxID=100907 RepID=A0AAD9F791_DISEL|nr:Poly [ADP-ribose] polymerase 1 [Dissostichus eleginoides]